MDPFFDLLKRFSPASMAPHHKSSFAVRQTWFFDQISLAGTYYTESLSWEDGRLLVADRVKLCRCHEICRFLLAMPGLGGGWQGYALYYLATRYDYNGLVVYIGPLLEKSLVACEKVEKRFGLWIRVRERALDALNGREESMWWKEGVDGEETGNEETDEDEGYGGIGKAPLMWTDIKWRNSKERNDLGHEELTQRGIVRENSENRERVEENGLVKEKRSWADETQEEFESSSLLPQPAEDALYHSIKELLGAVKLSNA